MAVVQYSTVSGHSIQLDVVRSDLTATTVHRRQRMLCGLSEYKAAVKIFVN